MGGYVNNNYKYNITLGSDKQLAFLLLGDYYKSCEIKKSEFLSIFSSEKDKKTAEQLFNIWNTTNNTDGSEEYIDLAELDLIGQTIAKSASKLTEDKNLSEEEIMELYKSKDIIGSETVLLEIVKYLFTKNPALNIESGKFIIDNKELNLKVTTLDDIDETGKTYKLAYNTNFFDAIFNNKKLKTEYIATFNSKDPDLKVLTSKIYADFLGDETLEEKKIVAPNGAVGTVKVLKQSDFNKDKKLALDILLGNNAPSDEINYDNTFDSDRENIKKSFNFIPDEIENIIKDNNYSKENLLTSLSMISEITDGQIEEMFNNSDFKDQYKTILIKRRDFCKALLEKLRSEDTSTNLLPQFNNSKISVIQDMIPAISDIRDIITYEKSIRNITNENMRNRLLQQLSEQKSKLLSEKIPMPLEPITEEQFIEKIQKYGFSTKLEPSERILQTYNHLDKYNSIKMSSKLSHISLTKALECANKRLEAGINVFADESSFVQFMLTEANLSSFDNEIKYYDYGTYMTILDSQNTSMTKQDADGIKSYKSDDSYTYFHEMLSANAEKSMPILSDMDEELRLTSLVNFLNKSSTPYDALAYRGESYSLFENVELPDGSKLSEKMEDAVKKLPDETGINMVIEEFNKLNGIEITQPKFISTSVNQEIATSFAERKKGICMNITIPAGSKAVCVDAAILKIFGKSSEAEILVQRGSDIIVKNISFDREKGYWIVDCVVETK